jgi:hypothetical protein
MSDDDFYRQMAERVEQERATKKESGYRPPIEGQTNKDFVQKDFTALETNKVKIFRAIGKRPNVFTTTMKTRQEKWDARVINFSKILDDEGKEKHMILPTHDSNPDHIIWRIIDKVNTVKWVDDESKPPKPDGKLWKKTVPMYKDEPKYKEIWNIIDHSNADLSLPRFKYGLFPKGWKGQELFIMNVIDRERMDWHRENKKTLLVAKNITTKEYVNNDGETTTSTFIDEGVPAFAITSALKEDILPVYGDWEEYDIGIGRTGETTRPYPLFNLEKNPEMLKDKSRSHLIVKGPITEEELEWERWDIETLYAPSYYVKWYNTCKKIIANIDATFGTGFLKELKYLVDKEADEIAQKKAEQESSPAPVQAKHHESAPVPASASKEEAPAGMSSGRRVVSSGVAPILAKFSDLAGWVHLTDAEKDSIELVEVENGKPVAKYYATAGAMDGCPKCNRPVPLSFTTCPDCGTRWSNG